MKTVTTVTCVDRPICNMIAELSYRRPVPPNPSAIDPRQLTFVGMGFKTERVLDVQAIIEDGETTWMHKTFTVYAMPNQYTGSKEKRFIGRFKIHLNESDSVHAVRNLIEKCVKDYEGMRS